MGDGGWWCCWSGREKDELSSKKSLALAKAGENDRQSATLRPRLVSVVPLVLLAGWLRAAAPPSGQLDRGHVPYRLLIV